MKILYVANARLPTEKAHGIQIMKMCEAFVREGAQVELVVPKRLNNLKEDPFTYYGVEPIFTIKRLPTLDLVRLGFIGFVIQSFSFAFFVFFYVLRKRVSLVYARDEFSLYFLSFLSKELIWETHTDRYNFLIKRVLNRSELIVSITEGLKQLYVGKGICSERILVAPDGVDLEAFTVSLSKEEARKRFGLPLDDHLVMYIGRLDDWKGYDTLLASANFFQNETTKLVIVGGDEKQVAELRKQYPEVIFKGYIPYRELPYLQRCADILVVPNTAKSAISREHTSPLKVFAHMTSGIPIVASDLPSLREILNESNAVLVTADDPEALAGGIKKVLEDKNLALSLAEKAKQDSKKYSWNTRARYIVNKVI